MPAALHPYLVLPGTTREAFEFYGEALGATPTFLTFGAFGDTAEGDPNAEKIMFASLEVTDLIRLYGSDNVEEMTGEPHTFGTHMTMSLMGDDVEVLRSAYEKLSVGGKVTALLTTQAWGDTYGSFTDRFGVVWQVNISARRD